MKNNNQNVSIFHRNAANIYNMMSGKIHIATNAGKPAVANSYIASKNRRKSNRTLPPFSCEYSDSLFEELLAIYFISRDCFQLQ